MTGPVDHYAEAEKLIDLAGNTGANDKFRAVIVAAAQAHATLAVAQLLAGMATTQQWATGAVTPDEAFKATEAYMRQQWPYQGGPQG